MAREKALEEDEELVISMLQLPMEESVNTDDISDKVNEHEQPGDSASSMNQHEQPMFDPDNDRHEQPMHENEQLPSTSVSLYAYLLKQYAKQHGYSVHDVPGDGDCLFSLMCTGLDKLVQAL